MSPNCTYFWKSSGGHLHYSSLTVPDLHVVSLSFFLSFLSLPSIYFPSTNRLKGCSLVQWHVYGTRTPFTSHCYQNLISLHPLRRWTRTHPPLIDWGVGHSISGHLQAGRAGLPTPGFVWDGPALYTVVCLSAPHCCPHTHTHTHTQHPLHTKHHLSWLFYSILRLTH